MPILFCNISWMEYYSGRSGNDPPRGGGQFPVDEGYCGEECNFVPCPDGFVYGHFETIWGEKDRQVKIERLGGDSKDLYLDGVDIVWTAPTRGNDPRTVVGWYKDARVYRHRQRFNGEFPSKKHESDEIRSFRVKARMENVVLLPVSERSRNLLRDTGWSGQASWWYADDTTSKEAKKFVKQIKRLIASGKNPPVMLPKRANKPPNKKAGAAASSAYTKYMEKYEVQVHPKHNNLQKSFAAHVLNNHAGASFPECYRDDLRYSISDGRCVMVEVKPAEPSDVRFAIRTAIGQLLDYRQDQCWGGEQLIVVGAKVERADDLSLAHENGFGLAWPTDDGFEVIWPNGKRCC